jgi:hypothetical protein
VGSSVWGLPASMLTRGWFLPAMRKRRVSDGDAAVRVETALPRVRYFNPLPSRPLKRGFEGWQGWRAPTAGTRLEIGETRVCTGRGVQTRIRLTALLRPAILQRPPGGMVSGSSSVAFAQHAVLGTLKARGQRPGLPRDPLRLRLLLAQADQAFQAQRARRSAR